MPNVIYNEGKRLIFASGIPANLIAILVKPTYNADPDHAAVDDGTANDPASHELTAGGYGRKSVTNPAVSKDLTTDTVTLDADDTAFGNLALGDTIGGIVLARDGANDQARVPILFYDVADTPTNGSAITIVWATVSAGALLKGIQV